MNTEAVINWMGGAQTLDTLPGSELELVELVIRGLPTRVIDWLLAGRKLEKEEIFDIIVPRRTLAHRKQKHQNLSREESERLARVAGVMAMAEETFQNKDKALTWMRRPRPSLGGHRPVDLLDTEQGARLVEAVLGRIAQGVYS